MLQQKPNKHVEMYLAATEPQTVGTRTLSLSLSLSLCRSLPTSLQIFCPMDLTVERVWARGGGRERVLAVKLLLAAAMPRRPSFNTWKSVRDGGRRKAHFGGNFTSEHFFFIYFRDEFCPFSEKYLGTGIFYRKFSSFLNKNYSPKQYIFILKSPNLAQLLTI